MENLLLIPETQECYRCQKYLPLDKFYKDPRYKNGVAGICKNCKNNYAKEIRDKNPEKLKNYRKNWVEKNPNLVEINRIRDYITYLTKRGYKVIAPTIKNKDI